MNSILLLTLLQVLINQTITTLRSERIVSDRNLLYDGLPVDYSYNETMSRRPGEFASVPGCPKANDGYPWVIFGDPPKCHMVGQSSDQCPKYTVIAYRPGSESGVCTCDFTKCRQESFLVHINSTSPRFDFCFPRGSDCLEYVYDKVEAQCRILYSRGTCKELEWLQLDPEDGVKCGRRLCPAGMSLYEGVETLELQNVQCCHPAFFEADFHFVNGNRCGRGKIWSEILRQCINTFNNSGLIIG